MSSLALIPSIIYKEIDRTYFFRLQFSLREIDETLKVKESQKIFKSCIKIFERPY